MRGAEKKYLYCSAFSAFFCSLPQWKELAGILGIRSEMGQQEYEVLLKGVGADVHIPLWASAALGERKTLADGTTRDVIAFYKKNGYEPQWFDGNPPDYLGEQFRFLAYLYGCADEDPECGGQAELFENRYTIATVKAFRDGIEKYGVSAEAKQLCRKLEAYFLEELPEPEERYGQFLCGRVRKKNPPVPTEAEHVIYSAGMNNCGGKCKINITVSEGCALRISTDDSDNAPQIRACVRGRGYRRTFLSPERLRYPMKRTGKRGEGKFRRISWEEAAEEIARGIRRCEETYGPESVYFMYGTGNCSVMRADHMLKKLVNLEGGYLDSYNSYSSACSTYVEPYIYGSAAGGNTERDMLNTRFLILWGHNPAETIFGSLRNYYLAQCRKAGIPIVVIDPRKSDTALALADEWIPIRPSTDGALADAMAYVIVKNNLHDLDFLHRFCVGFDEETMPEGAPQGGSYLSWLLGEADGIAKTPQWAEEITGIAAETIERLAIRYATAKPAMILPGFGPQRHGNGEQETRGIAALACLTGNVGKSGGGAGVPSFCPPRPKPVFAQGEQPYAGKIPVFLWSKAVEQGEALTPQEDGLKGTEKLRSGIKMIFNLAGNTLINQHSDINRTKRILEDETKCELIVVSDLFMTASARYADLLLPAASLFEVNNITAPWAGDDYLLSNSRALRPLFGALPDYDWVRLVARKLGREKEFTERHETAEEWLEDIYGRLREREPELPSYEEFRQRGGYQFRETPLRIAYRENIEQGVPFDTPSGKIELFSKRIYELHHPELPPIPRYVPAPEGPEDTLRKKYPLQLIGYHTKRRCHSIHDNNDWMEEVDPPALWIHPSDAAPRGICDGDLVEVFNDRGRVRIPAKVTERIMQGVTAMSQGGWYTPDAKGTDVRGSINVLTRADRPTPLAKGNPQHTNLVEVCGYSYNTDAGEPYAGIRTNK